MASKNSTQSDTATRARVSRSRRARQRAFLKAFVKCGTIRGAAAEVGLSRDTHYDWLRSDAGYAAQFERATEIVIGDCEDALYERAVHGIRKPVTVAGEREEVVEYDNRAAEFILRCRKPEVYGDRSKIEHTVPEKLQLAFIDKLMREADAAESKEQSAFPPAVRPGKTLKEI